MSHETIVSNDVIAKLKEWNKKNAIQCPSCKCNAFSSTTPSQCFGFHQVGDDIIKVSHHDCPYNRDSNRRKNKYFCLSCGKSSVHSKNRLLKTCTCEKRQDVAVKNQSRKPTTIDAGEISNNDKGDSRFDESDNQQIDEHSLCLNQSSDNECTMEFNGQSVHSEVIEKSYQNEDSSDNQHIDEQSFFLDQATNDKSTMEFDGQSVDSEKALKSDQVEGSFNLMKAWNEVEEPEEAMVSHPDSMSECPSSKSIFNDSNEWPEQSAKFFVREIETQGNGLRGVIYNALFDSKRSCGFHNLQIEEMFFHLHIATLHNNISQKNSQNVNKVISYMVKQHQEEIKEEREVFFNSFNSSINRVINNLECSHAQQNIIITQMQDTMKEHMKTFGSLSGQPKINFPVSDNQIRSCYTQGPFSIVKNLPYPSVSIAHKAAYISAKQVINHFLASGLSTKYYRVGYEEDWKDKVTGSYDCAFIRKLHNHVVNILHTTRHELDDVTPDTRVILVRLWSDGFEAHKIKAKNNFNNLQLFTLTVLAEPGKSSRSHTTPLALLHKKKNHHEIFIKILGEINSLQTPKWRYWGAEKKPIKTMVFLEMISNDLPERCSNTCTTLNGSFTHRWRHSCKFDESSTPSCLQCEIRNIEAILSPLYPKNSDESCDQCLDWWSRGVTYPSIYPLSPHDIRDGCTSYPPIQLSFEMIRNSIKHLHQVVSDDIKKNLSLPERRLIIKYSHKYLQLTGFSTSLVKGLVEDIMSGIDPVESQHFPLILKHYNELGLEMHHFQTMPMHLCFLGIEKNLISKTELIVKRNNKQQNEFWHSLVQSISQKQSDLNSVSIDWCLPMSFTNLDQKQLGTSSWQSDHYLAFTRVSLFHFSCLESQNVPDGSRRVIKVFKRLRVIWFCLISRLFTNIAVPPSVIELYVKIFLSSCYRFSLLTEQSSSHDQVSSKNKRKRVSSGKKRKRDQSHAQKKSKALKPFYTTTSNYFSLLNFGQMIRDNGSVRNCWEGENESYIQNIKREIIIMRHNETFLSTILRKLLETQVLSLFNQDNPFSETQQYARTGNMKIYKKRASFTDILKDFKNQNVVAGMIDVKNVMYVCYFCNDGISAYPLKFDDKMGFWSCNLWYSKTSLLDCPLQFTSKENLNEVSHDYFLLLKHKESDQSTLLCRSWRVRNASGQLELPSPQKDILLMK